jgi:uncharacterized protein YqeY
VTENQDLRGQLNAALKEAMKSKNSTAVSTIRLVLAALKDRDVSARGQGNSDGVPEAEILSMLQTMIKQRAESAQTYSKAGRKDLAEREEAEIVVIRTFLPRAIEGDELERVIDTAIQETGAESIKDMGKIMAYLKDNYAGQIDMGAAGGVVKKKLG